MKRQMLIDANHPEETRVVVLADKRLEEFDFEALAKKQLKGNIYLAKVTRVEPSLQAAFVDYGGNRHGFLPFSEIHPDYYRIPIADREALLAEEAAISAAPADDDEPEAEPGTETETKAEAEEPEAAEAAAEETGRGRRRRRRKAASDPEDTGAAGEKSGDPVEEIDAETPVDTLGGDDSEDDARRRAKLLRRYKIQEVIKRRQVLLVQVAKEERGNKGAALTTYLSLAGRYCVLMPNTNKGGGISRKIGNAPDRRRLKKVISELEIPDGMAVIVRTAGSQRSKAEIRRDYDYLLRLWDEIRESTLQSTAPALIYEEANLIKRAIRDLYSRDMDEIQVEGEEGYKAAKDFMKSLMPSHARKVHLYKDDAVPLMQRYQVEKQLDTMHSTVVQLGSGGYIVLNPTEALVAIDVNSGRATRERHIEETALRTNLEAASEIARQLRLRDLAGLIVIDFIDMEESRHNREVERRLKEAMRHDRARIQLGRISPFGLLELSRQRLRPSLFESSTITCTACGGSGRVRSTESAALQVLRHLEEEGVRRSGGKLTVRVPMAVALFILNQKRGRLIEIEQRYEFLVQIEQDENLIPPNFELTRTAEEGERASSAPAETAESDEAQPAARDEDRKRRRRRRGRRRDEEAPAEAAREAEEAESDEEAAAAPEDDEGEDGRRPRRRRGKRGGRRRSRRQRDATTDDEAATGDSGEAEAKPEAEPPAEEADAEGEVQPVEPSDAERPAKKAASRRGGRRRSRKTDAPSPAPEPVESTEEAEPPAAESAAADESAGEVSAASESAASESGAFAPLPLAAQPVDAEPAIAPPASTELDQCEPAAVDDDDDDKPKRRGWWNRLI